MRSALPVALSLAVAGSAGAAPDSNAPPPGCTDGGEDFAGALVDAHAVRYCFGEHCWAFDRQRHVLAPLSVAAATASHRGDAVIYPLDAAPLAPPRWTATVDGDGEVSVCDASACAPLPIAHAATADLLNDRVDAAAISPAGERVLVTRGLPGGARPQAIEVYDRSTQREIGVVRPTAACAVVVGWAGEVAVVQESDCMARTGPWLLVGGSGAVVARLPAEHTPQRLPVQIAGARWAVATTAGDVDLYDVERGTRLGGFTAAPLAILGAAGGTLFAFEPDAGVRAFDATGRPLGGARPAPCHWAFGAETIGPLRLGAQLHAVDSRLGAPRSEVPLAGDRLVLTYRDGVTLVVRAEPDEPRGHGAVIGIAITAPSALVTTSGIGIGSPAAAVRAAYRGHFDAHRSTPTSLVFDNADEFGGLTVELDGGKVSRISLSD